jgi:hypothetical protein
MSNVHPKISKILSILYLHLFFLASVVGKLLYICNFSLIKSSRAYPGHMRQPGGRNWQLIYPKSALHYVAVGCSRNLNRYDNSSFNEIMNTF